MTKKELEFLIEQGEGYNLEFKEGYNSSLAKEICAMANATGGRILIGVMDDGKIKPLVINNKIKSEIQDLARNFDPGFAVDISEFASIVIITVPEGKRKPYSTGGKFYMRQGANSQQLTRSEIRDFFIEEGLIAYDEKPNPNFNLAKDFNNKAFKKFLELAKIKTKLNKIDILKNLNLMFDNKRIKNAGVLLFGGDITRFIRSATITCATFQGNDKVKIIDRKEFDSDLLTNYESAFDYVSFRLNTEYIITKGPRIEKLEIPEEALREAILNAIAHRDYFSNANIQIYVFSDRVEIVNPGGIHKRNIKDLYKRSFPRNHLLFGLMQRMDIVEKIGSGLLRMNKLMAEYLLPAPIIDADDDWFSIIFQRPDLQKLSVEQRIKEGEKVGEKVGENTTENQKKIIRMIEKNNRITISELSKEVKMAEKNIEVNLKKLKDKGIIKRIGPNKGGYWKISGKY